MDTAEKLLAILQVAVPADTPLTVSSEVKMLEALGVVKNPQLIKAMQMAASLVPASTPATLKGLLQMLGGLMHMSDKAKPTHHRSIEAILAQLDAVPDETLTFGPFLAVCQTLMEGATKTAA